MGVGSQRVSIEKPEQNFFSIRRVVPKVTLFANIGAVQFNYGVSINELLKLSDKLQASAFILHLNPLQEAIQKEGNTNFSSLLSKIEAFKKKLSIPLIIKEVGTGLDLKSAKALINVGVDALDIAGKGGTHWGYIEGLREKSRQQMGELFRDWGHPTPSLLKELRKNLDSKFPIIASGGIRTGLDAAKAIYLGANLVGMALPFLKTAQDKNSSLESFFDFHCEALKIALFCSGSRTPEELKQKHG
jgi:isopentenyl-diphosphate delta-isomerase